MKYLILISLFVFAGCAKKDNSETVLKSFINDFFSQKMTKSDYLDYLAGSLYEEVDAMSDEDFSEYIVTGNYKKKKFKILLKSCSDDHCNLTYILKYAQKGSENEKYNVDVKKIAQLDKIDGQWKIMNITNAKTYIESKNTIKVHK